MKNQYFRTGVIHLLTFAILSLGITPYSYAGMLSTSHLVEQQVRGEALNRIDVLLAHEDIAKQMAALGVDRTLISKRLSGMSHSELITLQSALDKQVAGGDAVALVGAVFIVLLILELVGITDIFKSI